MCLVKICNYLSVLLRRTILLARTLSFRYYYRQYRSSRSLRIINRLQFGTI